MGRKKKVSTGRTVTTRSTRQSAKASTSLPTEATTAADTNSLDSENGSASQDASGENDSQDSNHTSIGPSGVPVTALCHKKFGKYRCLMLGDPKYQLLGNLEVSGSDSDAGSGVEVRVVDPCVSSESDCSTPVEFTNCSITTDSVPAVKTFSKLNHDTTNKTYLEKVIHSNLLETINCSSDSNTQDSPINLDSLSCDTLLPDPTLNLINNSDPRRGFNKLMCGDPIITEDTLSPAPSEPAPMTPPVMECFSDSAEVAEVTVGDDHDYLEDNNGDDEVMTVYEIIDENGSDNQDLYEGMNTEDIIYSEAKNSPQRPESLNIQNSNSNHSSSKITEDPEVEQSVKSAVVNDFQNRLSNIKIRSHEDLPQTEAQCLAMDCSVVLNEMTRSNYISHISRLEHKRDIPESAAPPILTPQSSLPKSSTTGGIANTVVNHSEEDTPAVNKLESDNMNCESNEATLGCSTDSSSCSSVSGVRRSNRIKTISVLKQRSKGHGLVRAPQKKTEVPLVKEVLVKVSENLCEAIAKSSPESFRCSASSVSMSLTSPSFPVPILDSDLKPVKVKSRWRRSSEMEMGSRSPVTPPLHSPTANGAKLPLISESNDSPSALKTDFTCTVTPKLQNDLSAYDEDTQRRLKQFDIILENEYHCDRTISKEARRMTCDCFLTKEEIERGELGCGEDCLNRLLMIECNSRCPVGDRCTNRRFQTRQYSNLRPMRTEKKGLGIQAVTNITGGDFLMEYVGEVLNSKHFNQRAEEYSQDKNRHHYFMALKGDAVIDATLKGNISRFINHSCDPNAETQKWTVNGELRIGFFSKRDINADDEITFDYQFQRYGKEAQKCFCEASNCRGWIGEEPDTDSEEEEEGSEDEEKTVEIKSEVEEGKVEVCAIKEEIQPDIVKDEAVQEDITEDAAAKKRGRPKKYARAAKELLQDIDLEDEMESLDRSGVKNQSQTLALCRAMVRAKRTSARAALLALLATADLPCRRLFLDYRGLRLLAPWCQDADATFRLDMLTALEKLPIPNKTILQECKLIGNIEKWLTDTCPNKSPKEDSSDNSGRGTPVLIDENTGLPVELPFKFTHKVEVEVLPLNEAGDNIEAKTNNDVVIHTDTQKEDIARLCNLLLDRWSQLKEIFKIPKRERIELMKEHERQANEPHARRERDKEAGVRRTRWEERYSRPDRDKKRSRPPSPELPRRPQIRSEEPVSSLSKEERRREFAERAARDEQRRCRLPPSLPPSAPPGPDKGKRRPLLPSPNTHKHWSGLPPEYLQGMPQGPHQFAPMMMNGIPQMQGMPPPEFMMPPNMGQFIPSEYMAMEYLQQKQQFMLPYCGPPQPMFPLAMMDPMAQQVQNYPNPGFMQMLGQNPNFAPPPMTPVSTYQNIPLPPNIPSLQQMPLSTPPMMQKPPHLPLPLPELPNQIIMMNPPPSMPPRPKTPLPQHIPSLVAGMPTTAGYPYPTEESVQINPPFYAPPIPETISTLYQCQEVDPATLPSIATPTDENQDTVDVPAEVLPWTPVRLPSTWRSMSDPRGRIYYYHVKLREPQWEPPMYSPTPHRDDESSEDEDASDEEEAENGEELMEEEVPSVMSKLVEGVDGVYQVIKEDLIGKNGIEVQASTKKLKKKRPGLVTNCWIISPRREEDRIANQLELKRYKENKEKLRRRKEQALLAAAQSDAIILKYKKRLKDKNKKTKLPTSSSPSSTRKKKEADLVAEESERRIKEIFRSRMARVMVHHLNPFRKDDCPLGRIADTADFKHLARKLTHFVMLKELKHCKDVNELDCNDSVKQKAKEFVKKYMAKFGPVYRRPLDELD